MNKNWYDRKRIENRIADLVSRQNPISENIGKEMIADLINSEQNIDEILNDLYSLYFKSDLEIERYIESIKKEEKASTISEEEIKQALNMENITDFKIEEKNYIKINFNDNNTFLIENNNNINSKEIFEHVQQIINANNSDGLKNSEEIFNYLRKKYVEIPLENTKFIDSHNHSEEETKKLAVIDSNYPNSTILASLEQNIYILKNETEKIIRVVMKDGVYVIEEIEQQKYETTKEDNLQKNDISTHNHQLEQPLEMDYNNTTETIQTKITNLIIEGKNKEQIFEALAASKNITDINEQRMLFEVIEEQYEKYHNSISTIQQDKIRKMVLPDLKQVA